MITLRGITEKELKESEAEMRRSKNLPTLLAKRTALVFASKLTGLDYADLGTFLGYAGVTLKQRASNVEGVLKDCGNVHVDEIQPLNEQFLRVYDTIRDNMDRIGNPLFRKK